MNNTIKGLVVSDVMETSFELPVEELEAVNATRNGETITLNLASLSVELPLRIAQRARRQLARQV